MPLHHWMNRKPKIVRKTKAPDESDDTETGDITDMLSASQVLGMQKLIGNQAVMRLYNTNKRPNLPADDEQEQNDETPVDKARDVLTNAAPPPVQRKPLTIQREIEDPRRIKVVKPSSSNPAALLEEMMKFTQRTAAASGNPDSIKGVYYLIVTDAVSVYDYTGSKLDRIPFEPQSENAQLPDAGYYYDAGGGDGKQGTWQTYSEQWGNYGFRSLSFQHGENMQLNQWMSADSFAKLETYASQANTFFMVITSNAGGSQSSTDKNGVPNGTSGGTGNAKKLMPAWAKNAEKTLKKKLAEIGAGGLGQTGSGKGGGGTSQTESGSESEPAGQGTGTQNTPDGYNPLPDKVTLWLKENGSILLNVRVGASVEVIQLKEGETEDELLRRVQEAVMKMRADADPNRSTQMKNGATETGIVPDAKAGKGAPGEKGGKGGTPGGTGTLINDPERMGKGGEQVANARAYPSRIVNYGDDQTVTGATNRFSMTLDYAIAGADVMSQFAGRMQPIQYYWELIDVTGVGEDNRKSSVKDTTIGEGEELKKSSGVEGDIARADAAIAEDTAADEKDVEESNWLTRAAYLSAVGISNEVRTVGARISGGVSIITMPMNERSFSFNREGEFIIRCVATPQADDAALADPDNHVIRQSSIAVAPLKVTNINTRAQEAMDEEAADVLEMKKQLKTLPAGSPERDALLAQIHTRETENTPEAIARQLAEIKERFETLNEMRQGLKDNNLKQCSPAARMLYVQLEFMNQSATQYENDLTRTLEQLKKLKESANVMGGQISGDVARVKTLLVSEENGQVIQMLTMLGLSTTQPGDGKVSYTFADVTSPATRDYYEGTGSADTAEGHREAIKNALENFRANNGYGRGTLKVRTSIPVVLSDKSTVTLDIDETMRSAPGTKKRVLQRLQDLATAAEIAGLILSGGAGMAVGVLGGLAGGVVAGVGLVNRARTGTLEWDFQTIMDITSLIGGALSLAQPAAALASGVKKWEQTAEKVGDMLHFAGQGMMAGQILVVPASLAIEFAAIANEPGLSPGEIAARRAEALLQAVRTNLITIITARGPLEFEGGAKKNATEPNLPDVHPNVPDVTPQIDNLRQDGNTGETNTPRTNETPATETGITPRTNMLTGGENAPHPRANKPPFREMTPDYFDVFFKRALATFEMRSLNWSEGVQMVSPDDMPALYQQAEGKPMPPEVVGFQDARTGKVYLNKEAMTPAMRGELVKAVTAYLPKQLVFAFGDEFAAALVNRQLETIIPGAKDIPSGTVDPDFMTLLNQLEAGAGVDLTSLMAIGELKDIRSALEKKFGSGRAGDIEAAIKAGQPGAALDLMVDTRATLGNALGDVFAAGVEDLIRVENGGKPGNTARYKLMAEIAEIVGKDVLKKALVQGEVEPLRQALDKALTPDRAKKMLDAFAKGNIDDAHTYLTSDVPILSDHTGRPAEAPTPAHPEHGDSVTPTAGVHALALKKALSDPNAGDPVALAHQVLLEVKDFKGLRKMVEDGVFGDKDKKDAARDALQKARQAILADVLGKVRKKILKDTADKIDIDPRNLGTPGFKSDCDITMAAVEAVGANANGAGSDKPTLADRVKASVAAVEEAYTLLKDMGLPADKALDSNFYSKMLETEFAPKDAAEGRQIVADQSVISLAEMRMNMSDLDWNTYKAEQLEKLGKGKASTGFQADIDFEAQAKMKKMFKKAEKIIDSFGDISNPDVKAKELTKLRNRLMKMLNDTKNPPSPVALRGLMGKIMLLEPDAYGTYAAYESVVNNQQALARSDGGQQVSDIRDARSKALNSMDKPERLATLTQEASASMAKMFGHAHAPGKNSPADAIAISKYLGRIYAAFHDAGYTLRDPLLDRVAAIVGAKQDSNTTASAMLELRGWAQDTNRSALGDSALIDAYISQAQLTGRDLVSRMRAGEMTSGVMRDMGF